MTAQDIWRDYAAVVFAVLLTSAVLALIRAVMLELTRYVRARI